MNPSAAPTGWTNPFFVILGLVALGALIGFAIGVTVAGRRGPTGGPSPAAHRRETGATSEAKANETRRDLERRAVSLLRGRRHAFLNHLQVISGWLQLGNVERAAAYIDRVLRDMEEEGRFIRAADPSLVAFFLAKEEQAKMRGIQLTTTVDPGLATPEEVAATVEPALEAVLDRLIETSPRSGARLSLSLGGDGRTYRLTIETSGGADTWLAAALAATGARRQAPGRWTVTWPVAGGPRAFDDIVARRRENK